MSYMTRLEGVPDTDDIRPGMAHFMGTGPENTKCGGCKHRGYYRQSTRLTVDKKTKREGYKTYRTGACAMFKKLTGRHGGTINRDWASCRHYEAKPNDH